MKRPNIAKGEWQKSGLTVFSLTPYTGDSPRMAKALPDGVNRFSARVSGDNPVSAGGAPLAELEATAQFIAAAPAMAEALEIALKSNSNNFMEMKFRAQAALTLAGYEF